MCLLVEVVGRWRKACSPVLIMCLMGGGRLVRLHCGENVLFVSILCYYYLAIVATNLVDTCARGNFLALAYRCRSSHTSSTIN